MPRKKLHTMHSEDMNLGEEVSFASWYTMPLLFPVLSLTIDSPARALRQSSFKTRAQKSVFWHHNPPLKQLPQHLPTHSCSTAQGLLLKGVLKQTGRQENRAGRQRPTVWILLSPCVWLGAEMPSPLPVPTGLLGGTGSRCSGLLVAAALGLRQAHERSTVGLALQHEVQRLNSQSDFTRRKSWSGLKALREEQTQGLVFLLKI